MRARYEVTYNRNDTVDLKLSGVTILGYEQSDPERGDDHVTLGMTADAFEFLTGDKVRAHLKTSLDDALSQIQRLSDERDEWKEEAGNRQKEADLWKSLAERQDNTAPLRMELGSVKRERDRWQREAERLKQEEDERRKVWLGPSVLYTTAPVEHTWTPADETSAQLDDELKAVIVSQAREIARLKGESE